MDLRTQRDNLLQGLRREDEELLRPSKEEQEGCCGVEVCGRLLAHLAIWQIQFINWSECNFFFQKGKIQKKMSSSFNDALWVPCRFGTAGQSARQCFMEILEARGTTCKDSRLDATWAKSNGWRWLVNQELVLKYYFGDSHGSIHYRVYYIAFLLLVNLNYYTLPGCDNLPCVSKEPTNSSGHWSEWMNSGYKKSVMLPSGCTPKLMV